MARVTVEDCIDKVANRFELVLLAVHRARSIAKGSAITLDSLKTRHACGAFRDHPIGEMLGVRLHIAGLALGSLAQAFQVGDVVAHDDYKFQQHRPFSA